jgi:hypothetical protein
MLWPQCLDAPAPSALPPLAGAGSPCEDAREAATDERIRGAGVTQEPQRDEGPDALYAGVLARHGARLDEGQRQVLREHVERLRGVAAQLDGYRLANADEPDFAFRAIDRVDSA